MPNIRRALRAIEVARGMRKQVAEVPQGKTSGQFVSIAGAVVPNLVKALASATDMQITSAENFLPRQADPMATGARSLLSD